MFSKKIVGYFILLIAIFCSFLFIASENGEYVRLQNLEKKIKAEIYTNIQEHKKNLYEIEKQKIRKNTNTSTINI